jgi:sigma-B regulation protein RsbU (phosphoserine phosphatase)
MPIRILSVDDETDLKMLMQMKFRKQIKQNEYEFYFAHNGLEAVELLEKNQQIDIILADINMPEMNGIQLLDRINHMNLNFAKTVMVTAYSDMGNLRKAMNRGAFDFVTKPIDFEDLEITIRKTYQTIQNLRQAAAYQKKLQSLEQELEVARKIQLSLVPCIFPPFPSRTEIDIYASMNAAKSVGGDFYDYFLIDDQLLGFVIGDVSGKGIPAALFMAFCMNTIRSVALKGLSPEKCLQESNDLISKESLDSMFVTVFYGILNTLTGEFSYSNGGHNSPYLMLSTGEVYCLETTQNAILGGMSGLTYHKKTISLKKGDGIFFYTDGIPEAENEIQEFYSDTRLKQQLLLYAKESLTTINEKIKKDIQTFVGQAEQSDDITIMICRYL